MNTRQCDENAHLNVQFYTEFGHEASAHLMASLGLGRRAQAADRKHGAEKARQRRMNRRAVRMLAADVQMPVAVRGIVAVLVRVRVHVQAA